MKPGAPETSVFVRALVLAAAALLIGLLAYKAAGLRIETNILHTLPRGNPVMADGHQVIIHHPYQNRVLIDLGIAEKNPDLLAAAAGRIDAHLRQTGLFQSVGMEDAGRMFSMMTTHAAVHLPKLLTAGDLEGRVAALLENGVLEKRVKQNLSLLYTMEGTGQARTIISDPLGLRNLVLEKTRALMPAQNIEFYKGRLFSPDRDHVLIIADPRDAATGSQAARRIQNALRQAEEILSRDASFAGADFTLTPVGAYRAVIDNETAAKNDARQAVLLSALGIAALLMLAFPRPAIGLLAFVPAVFGTLAALAFYAVWQDSISIMALGFGGAIIAITVDHGISYLLFADQPHETKGRTVSREIWAVGLVAALTSSGAFFMLTFSGFPILAEIGQFAAFGILFSFLFVHTGFPLLFPVIKPAGRSRRLYLQTAVDWLVLSGKKAKLAAALALAVVLAFFARPDFCADISAINTVTRKTIAAEQHVAAIWGGQVLDRIHLMARAPDMDGLQQISDRLAKDLAQQVAENRISEAFLPSMLFPGPDLCSANLEAWQQFWNKHGREKIAERISHQAEALGMDPETFSQVYAADNANCSGGVAPDPRFYEILGIHPMQNSDGSWMLFSSLAAGDSYDPALFFNTVSSGRPDVFVLDPGYYSLQLGRFLSETFLRMLTIIAAGVVVLLLVFFADVTLTLVALLPLGFSLVCTLAALHLLGQPLNIPGLMLSVIVLGMGLDYSLYFVRAHQRYGSPAHPFQAHIRMAVFLAAASTLIGFSALGAGEHHLMKSLGRILAPAVGFVLIGTFCLLPAALDWVFRPANLPLTPVAPGSASHKKRLRRLYRHMEAYPRLFAALKRRMDPMFSELPALMYNPRTVFDVGCGYGVTAAWLLAMDPRIRICGMDPVAERVRFAGRITGQNAVIHRAAAPDLPDPDNPADTVLMLDMIHYLSDAQLAQTLAGAYIRMHAGGRLIIRAAVSRNPGKSLRRRVERICLNLQKIPWHQRTGAQIERQVTAAGFEMLLVRASGSGWAEKWFVGKKPHHPGGPA